MEGACWVCDARMTVFDTPGWVGIHEPTAEVLEIVRAFASEDTLLAKRGCEAIVDLVTGSRSGNNIRFTYNNIKYRVDKFAELDATHLNKCVEAALTSDGGKLSFLNMIIALLKHPSPRGHAFISRHQLVRNTLRDRSHRD